LKIGSRIAFTHLIDQLDNGRDKKFSALFAKDSTSQDNAKDNLMVWKTLSASDKTVFGQTLLKNITTHSSVTRVQEVHWRDRDKVEIHIQLETLLVATLKDPPSDIRYHDDDHFFIKSFTLFFVSIYIYLVKSF